MPEKPKPCPWCGKEPAVFHKTVAACGTSGCIMYHRAMVIRVWNTRPIESRLETELLSLRKASHSVSQCCPESERLARENQELRAIVEKLPKTANGVSVAPGDVVYCPDGHRIKADNVILREDGGIILCDDDECFIPDSDGPEGKAWGGPAEYLLKECYSTREAAVESLAARGAGR